MEVKVTVESSTWFTVNNNIFSALGTARIPCVSLVTSNNDNKTWYIVSIYIIIILADIVMYFAG
jgi:hypothetical protein